MEGQTICPPCEYKSRNIGSLKQHMESKHDVFNMTIVQVLTQQIERVDKLEKETKQKRTADQTSRVLNAKLEKEASEVSKQTVFQLNEVSTQSVSQNEVSTQSVSELIEVANVKQEESEANNKEMNKSILCKYFHKTK